MRGRGCCFADTCAQVAAGGRGAFFSRAGRKKDGKADLADIAKINVFAVILKSPTPSEHEKSLFMLSYAEAPDSV